MSSEVVKLLTGRTPSQMRATPAILESHSRWKVKGYVFPGTIPSSVKGSYVQGLLLYDLKPHERRIFDWFEANAYTRVGVKVKISKSPLPVDIKDEYERSVTEISTPASVRSDSSSETFMVEEAESYIWTNSKDELIIDQNSTGNWDDNVFRKEHLDWYLNEVIGPCREELNELDGFS